MDSAALDALVLGALDDLGQYLRSSNWLGRENELVNLFAFGHLLPRACPPVGSLDPTQIAIEVAVPQLADWSAKPKRDVRKDLVIWKAPRTTNWTSRESGVDPVLAILEWKSLNNIGIAEDIAKKRREHDSDIDWLSRVTRSTPEVTGYAIIADLKHQPIELTCTVVRGGVVSVAKF